ncbi:MAG: TonB-dependent receptor, partial [Bryobacterales bacterium]|nr:TonB-dependent receptor [Bryobacterales bacterium]
MRLVTQSLRILLLTFLACAAIFAQATSGSMSGTVKDPNGAVVPGAKIVATHLPTGREYPAQTTDAGLYVFPSLPPGPYSVTVRQPGFKELVRTGVEIRVGQRQDLDLTLEVGEVQQKIEVTAEAPLLETTSAERGQNISPQVLQSLPIYTGGLRSAEAFVGYMPGVNANAEVSINGSNGRAKEIFIDGASITIPESGGTNFYFPGFEAYQEMKLITGTFNPEYGRLGGGLEMFTTRSGTNDIHASAFWNWRRDVLEAAGWASNQVRGRTPGFRTKVRLNEQGGTAGGPVWIPKVYDGRNRTFFYFTYARDIRPATPVSATGETVPTTRMKQGDFGELAYGIFDPATTALSNGVLARTPFANNQIPKSRWSRISTNIVPVIPDPNSGGGVISNYTLTGAAVHDDYIYTIKADHSFTDKHRVAFFMTRRSYSDAAPSQFAGALGNGLLSGQYPEDYRGNYDWVISPTKLLHLTFGESETIQRWNNPEQRGWGSKFGFPGLTGRSDATPVINFDTDNLTGWGMNQGKVDNGGQFNYTYQWAGQLSIVRGKHEFKVGGDVRRLQTTGDDWAGTNGFYYFSRFQTADPANKNATGNAFASLLLGAPDRANQTTLPVVIGQIRYSYYAGFFQDNWRITPRLTINYGIRYEVPIGWHSRDGLYSNLDITKPNAGAGGLPGAMVFAGSGAGRSGVKRFYPTDFGDVGPRL